MRKLLDIFDNREHDRLIGVAYNLNKASKVGSECICPSCQVSFIKGSYQQVFCKSKDGTKCKDKYWNTVDPNKRCNTTRISPASAAWSARKEEFRDDSNFDDDQSWDAHKDY